MKREKFRRVAYQIKFQITLPFFLEPCTIVDVHLRFSNFEKCID